MRREAEERAKHYQAKLERLEDELADRARGARARRRGRARAHRDARPRPRPSACARTPSSSSSRSSSRSASDLRRETVEAAVAAAEELLKKRVTPADQERLAEDYLADLGGNAGRRAAAAGPRESAS